MHETDCSIDGSLNATPAGGMLATLVAPDKQVTYFPSSNSYDVLLHLRARHRLFSSRRKLRRIIIARAGRQEMAPTSSFAPLTIDAAPAA